MDECYGYEPENSDKFVQLDYLVARLTELTQKHKIEEKLRKASINLTTRINNYLRLPMKSKEYLLLRLDCSIFAAGEYRIEIAKQFLDKKARLDENGYVEPPASISEEISKNYIKNKVIELRKKYGLK